MVVLPHGLGKSARVLVFAQGDGAALAVEGGADFVADDDELINKIQRVGRTLMWLLPHQINGQLDAWSRALGPRGYQCQSQSRNCCARRRFRASINGAKRWPWVEFRVDKTANLHVPIGKVSLMIINCMRIWLRCWTQSRKPDRLLRKVLIFAKLP